MAKLEEIPAEHRSAASRIKHLDSMPAEEATHRAKHVAAMEGKAPMTGEARNLVFAHTSRLLSAIPVKDYLDRIGHLNELAAQLPGGIDGAGTQARQAALKLKAENVYPPGLVEACGKRLLGKEPVGYTECNVSAVLGLETEKAKVMPKRDSIAVAAEKALAGLDAKEAALRKEIGDWKAKIAADYAAANRPVPAGLNLPRERHPAYSKAQELSYAADSWRLMAEEVSADTELSQFYRQKARETDDKAERMGKRIA